MTPPKKKKGRKSKRPESEFINGKVLIDLPCPIHESEELIGYEWKKVDLIKLLNTMPMYSPFTEAKGFHFNTEEAELVINFVINECVFPEGKLTGKPFIPEKWQWAIYLNSYCWFSDDKPLIRRYNEVFIYVPRKNGKTTAFGAIPALISIFVDPEPRSQNFCCAADVEQASLNFRHAAYMVEQNPKLLNRLTQGKVRHGTRYMEHNNGKTLKVLSSIAETKHGLSPNYVGVDELHAHKSSELVDVMETGTAARDSPLILHTTTADYDRPSLCNDIYKRSLALAKGLQSNPHSLPVIYEALPTDDWEDPRVWRKANPNFGVSIRERYFRKELNKVKNSPKLLNRFLRLHLNVRTAVETTWIYPHVWSGTNPSKRDLLTPEEIRFHMELYPDWFSVLDTEQWKSSSVDIFLQEYSPYYTWFFRKVTDLQSSPCFGGYDNSASKDIASLTLWFPETHDLLSWNWVPSESIETRSVEDNIPYQNWHSCGLINNTPMQTIDEDHVIKAMLGHKGTGILEHFEDVNTVAFDAWGVNYIMGQLDSYGLNVRRYPQSFAGMNQPCKTLETFLDQKNFFHGGHPILEWMIGNTMVTQDNNDKIRPCRKNSTDKIDGIVSSLMALGAWMFDEDQMIDEIPGLKTQEAN